MNLRQDPISQLDLEPLRRLSSSLEQLIATHLWAKVLVGMVLGIATGLLLGPEAGLISPALAAQWVHWLSLPGTLFLALVQMVVVPLVFASIVRGLAAGESVSQLKKLGMRAGGYFLVTSTVAIGLGLALGMVVQPGRFAAVDAPQSLGGGGQAVSGAALPGLSGIPDAIVGLLPANPLASMVSGEMLQIILFAAIIGAALVALPQEKSAPLFDLLGSLQEVCMMVVRWAMRFSPIAVFGLIARLVSQLGFEVLLGMVGYVLTVLVGLLTLLGLYVLAVWLLGRVAPREFLSKIRELQLLAFSTSSSAAVMPLSLQTAEQRLRVRPSTAGFLIPLGATINMDGTALYQGVATVFLAQVYGVELPPSALAMVVVTAVAASIGSPATPGVGVIVLSTVLQSAGIPSAGLALLIGVDRILDMCRTAVNVSGDITAAVILDRMMGAEESGAVSAASSAPLDEHA